MISAKDLRNKTASAFDRCFFIVFIILSILTALAGYMATALFGELGTDSYPVYIVIGRYILLLLAFGAVAVMLVLIYRRIMSCRSERLDSGRSSSAVIAVAIGLMLAAQLACAYLLRTAPKTDVAMVGRYAIKAVEDGSFDCVSSGYLDYYIVRYQNNLTYLFIVTAVYKVTYMLTGAFSRLPLFFMNALALNASVLLTALTARRLFGRRRALFSLILCALFAPYYSYAAYCYTDSLSLPFIIGAVYCFVRAEQSDQRSHKAIALALGGALSAVGYEIKASTAVLMIALPIYLLLRYGLRRGAISSAPALLSFAVVAVVYSVAVKASGIIPPELSDRYQFPFTHWIMVGLSDSGGYTAADSAFTARFTTKAAKTAANLEEIGARLSKKGVLGTIWHVFYKAVWTWMDGTYYSANYLVGFVERSPLHSMVLYDGQLRLPYYAYCSGSQLFLILSMALSALKARREARVDIMTFMRIAVTGIFIFFLIWEANSRYPFNFSPLYILLATDGVSLIARGKMKLALRQMK